MTLVTLRGLVFTAVVILWSFGAMGVRGQEINGLKETAEFELNVVEVGDEKGGPGADFVSGGVFETFNGELRVLAKGRGRNEVWMIGGDGGIVDTGYLSWPGAGLKLRAEWESAEAREWPLKVGASVPWVSLGERFGAFQVTDWLIEKKGAVGLPFLGGEDIAFTFRADGAVMAKRKAGEDAPGQWWWSRGLLHVRLDGLENAATYEWRALARHVGWKKGMVAAVQPESVVESVPGAPKDQTRGRSVPGGVFACPRNVLNRLLVSATDRSDVVAALALEKQTLELCAERQRLVAEIVSADIGIEKMLKEEGEKKEESAVASIVRTVAELESVSSKEVIKPVDRTNVIPDARGDVGMADVPGKEQAKPAAEKRDQGKAAEMVVAFTWFTMLGTSGKLVAGVTDGRRSWFVRAGDVLPDGGVVTAVTSRPPRVKVAGRGLLAWSSRPPAEGGELEQVRDKGVASGAAVEPIEEVSKKIVGRGRAIDGDTLDVAGVRVRLLGVDAPEKRQNCRTGSNVWSCGGLAAAALRSRSGEISCERQGRDEYGNVVARCVEGGVDVGGWLVSEGWALAHGPGSGGYVEVQERAKADKKGIHRGDYVVPWEWRRGRRLKPAGEVVTGGEGGSGGSVANELPGMVQEGATR